MHLLQRKMVVSPLLAHTTSQSHNTQINFPRPHFRSLPFRRGDDPSLSLHSTSSSQPATTGSRPPNPASQTLAPSSALPSSLSSPSPSLEIENYKDAAPDWEAKPSPASASPSQPHPLSSPPPSPPAASPSASTQASALLRWGVSSRCSCSCLACEALAERLSA